MNPLTNVKNLNKLNQRELELGVTQKTSWHNQYKDSAWIFVGGLPYDLTEGDVLCVFSQYGEIMNINMVRDKNTGKTKGYAFICYEDQRSTILAVDNFNGTKLLGRVLRVDHVSEYRKPKETGEEDELIKTLRIDGCGPKTPPLSSEESEEEAVQSPVKKRKKDKSKKKKKMKSKKVKQEKHDTSGGGNNSDSDSDKNDHKTINKDQDHETGTRDRTRTVDSDVTVKREKHDPGYDRYSREIKSDRSSSQPIGRLKEEEEGDNRDRGSSKEHGRHRDGYVEDKQERRGFSNTRTDYSTKSRSMNERGGSGQYLDEYDRSRDHDSYRPRDSYKTRDDHDRYKVKDRVHDNGDKVSRKDVRDRSHSPDYKRYKR